MRTYTCTSRTGLRAAHVGHLTVRLQLRIQSGRNEARRTFQSVGLYDIAKNTMVEAIDVAKCPV